MTPRLLAITPAQPGPWVVQLPRLVHAGVDGLLIRLLREPAALPSVIAALPPGLMVLVRPSRAEDAEQAIRAGLGLHLPSHWSPAAWRGRHAGLQSAACHDRVSLTRAASTGCDMALLSPVYPPGSKPGDRRPVLGVPGFAALADTVSIPVLALGGMTPARVTTLRGAAGVAGISAFFKDNAVDEAGAAAMSAAMSAE